MFAIAKRLCAVALLAAIAVPGMAANDAAPISRESTENFLNGVPDFAGGKPSANMVNSNDALRGASGSTYVAPNNGSVTVMPVEKKASTGFRLHGGTIERRTVTPYSSPSSSTASSWR